MPETVKGIVDRYIFFNEENGYSIIKLKDTSVIVGTLPKLNQGESIEVSGNWIVHPKFGKQFKIENFSIAYPTTKTGVINYLGSGLIKGIGKSTAEKIYSVFGTKTLDILEKNIHRLLEVEGIGEKKLEMIKKGWAEQQGIKNVMLFLQSYGISTAYSLKIYKTYGNTAPEIIKQNPYRLISDVYGIGFKIADQIGKKLGIEERSPMRIKAGILFVLNEISKNGHTYCPEIDLIESVTQTLNYDLASSDTIIQELQNEGLIVIHKKNIYLADLYYAERGIEESMKLIQSIPKEEINYEKLLRAIENRYSKEQLAAIKYSLSNKILIITGGPGTGKTTALKGIIDIYKRMEKKILLAAPTGRAAKRMAEVIKMEAKTIHRLLEFNPSDNSFAYNKFNQLSADLIIIDEVSMIDTYLMYHLITAIDTKTTIVFVGDIDQLPSVGPGNVLRDLINSNSVSVVRLNKIFRQAESSDIIKNAHLINKGAMPVFNAKDTDFVFLDEKEPVVISEKILALCKDELPSKLKFDPLLDIQVITPMYKGDVGVNYLNKLFQARINKNDIIYSQGDRIFKAGDKIMQLRNNYDKNIYNGDIGFLIEYDDENKNLVTDFEGRLIKYSPDEFDEITLAYAITVHKSQGSEYPCIIMPMVTQNYIMLQRNLLYTGITRASKLLIMLGSKQAVSIAVNNNKVQRRFTTLFSLD
ncbi:MAG: ATP-dependent RecD-like DNA helicase [Ignavibacteriales bacterium CG_4_9_14_3_um_filter_34_10]|nr:MAG: ATP-dependent RecD-like DNA helicase [Ignavibacteriales bacterium CG_4_9_14_3_um_filter_34_10]